MTEREAFVVMNLLPGMGPVKGRRLVDAFGSAAGVLAAGADRLRGVEGVGAELAETLVRWEDRADPAAELARADACGARVLTLADADYPASLRQIHDPPFVLYVRGSLGPRDARGIAVIGTRTPSYYGREMTRRLSFQIAHAGVTVVSGLARGVDTAAHEGALAAKGRTVAVLGCGIDRVYPPENEPLARRIEESGAVIAEFPMGTTPDRQTFPIRNRVVSGLSQGVLVVEAPLNSGSLITANMALEQGRQVFAVPGRADQPQSRGCHRLLRDGARLVEDAGDVLGELGWLIPPEPAAATTASKLTGNEARVEAAVGDDEADLDDVIRRSELPASAVAAALMKLEMKRRIRQLPGRRFVRTT